MPQSSLASSAAITSNTGTFFKGPPVPSDNRLGGQPYLSAYYVPLSGPNTTGTIEMIKVPTATAHRICTDAMACRVSPPPLSPSRSALPPGRPRPRTPLRLSGRLRHAPERLQPASPGRHGLPLGPQKRARLARERQELHGAGPLPGHLLPQRDGYRARRRLPLPIPAGAWAARTFYQNRKQWLLADSLPLVHARRGSCSRTTGTTRTPRTSSGPCTSERCAACLS